MVPTLLLLFVVVVIIILRAAWKPLPQASLKEEMLKQMQQ